MGELRAVPEAQGARYEGADLAAPTREVERALPVRPSNAPARNVSASASRKERDSSVLWRAGSLRLCDRRVQSSSCRTSFAEQRTRKSLAAVPARERSLELNGHRHGVDEVHAGPVPH